jgi:hypothetical protein
MPKLYVFAICEKVITDASGVPSLIGLFNKITAATAPGAEIPASAVAPKEYAIFTSWDVEPSDIGKEYTELYEMFYPDGSQFGERNRLKVAMGHGKRSNCSANAYALPIGQAGLYTVRTWLEDDQGRVIFEPISLQFEVEVIRSAGPT